jgi:phosphoserine aminotransferase
VFGAMSSSSNTVKSPMFVRKMARSSPSPGTSSRTEGKLVRCDTADLSTTGLESNPESGTVGRMQAKAAPRIFNFSAGPAILPQEVLERAAEAVRELDVGGRGIGLSLLEISHRSPEYEGIHAQAIELVYEVLGIPRTADVLLLQGGASLQFAMIPMNFARQGEVAAYVDTGVWASNAIMESKVVGELRGHETAVIASSKASNYDHIPTIPSALPAKTSYVHVTSNNTIFGTEYEQLPTVDAPMIVDASSNIGSRPMGLERATFGYAGAQKNLGPSGVTLVWFDREWAKQATPAGVPVILRYKTHVEKEGMYNTPNTFGALVLKLVLEWVREHGGVEAMGVRNDAKADLLYGLLDSSSLFRAHAKPGSRSRMNVTWTLDGAAEAQREDLTKKFVKASEAAGFSGLKGHRSVGGCRASIYNAFPLDGVAALCEFMREFERTA